MSANPQAMMQMLASQLGGAGGQAVGGQAVQQPALGAAAQLAQKIMLMQALQKGAPQGPQQAPQGPVSYVPGMQQVTQQPTGQTTLFQPPQPGAIGG